MYGSESIQKKVDIRSRYIHGQLDFTNKYYDYVGSYKDEADRHNMNNFEHSISWDTYTFSFLCAATPYSFAIGIKSGCLSSYEG